MSGIKQSISLSQLQSCTLFIICINSIFQKRSHIVCHIVYRALSYRIVSLLHENDTICHASVTPENLDECNEQNQNGARYSVCLVGLSTILFTFAHLRDGQHESKFHRKVYTPTRKCAFYFNATHALGLLVVCWHMAVTLLETVCF